MKKVIKFKKLVRDKIPEILKKRGQRSSFHIAKNEEYWKKLKEKLKEEVEEFLKKSSKEELTDILEVIYAICDFKKIKKEDLEKIRKRKTKERGAFKRRIILDEVEKET